MITGPTGKLKNCDTWAQYEPPTAATTTKALCNGGNYQGEHQAPCPSRYDCVAVTPNFDDGRIRPPLFNPTSVQTLATTPTSFGGPRVPVSMPQNSRYGQQPVPQVQQPLFHPGYGPVPVQPPEHYPARMQSPYVQSPTAPMGITPTFLPMDNEHIATRIAKNAFQGSIGAIGWHIFSMAQSLDFWRR